MELKISKIQWKKVLAFILTLCMTITMVQIPVNAEETSDEGGKVSRHLNVGSLEYYDDTATFFDAELNPDVAVTPIQKDTNYTVNSSEGAYDAKWFAFTPENDGIYVFRGENLEGDSEEVDSYGCLLKKNGESYDYIKKDDDSAQNYHFSVIAKLEAGKTYYLCAGFYSDSGENTRKYNISVSKKDMDGTITYAQPVNYMTDGVSRIYKFTAQHDGAHVFKAAWNRTDVYMEGWEDSVEDADGSYVEMNHIATEKNAFYESFDCEAGKTYYIIMHDIYLCTDDTYEERVYNENATLSIAYYGGKTDIDTIKQNEKNNANNNNANNTKPDNTVTVAPASIKVSSIKIAALSNKIAAGKKVKLAATIAPENASNKAVKWITSNKKVAKVSQSGVVTVNKKAAGKSVVITAIAADGNGARATYKIKVMKDAVKRLTVTGKKVVKAGKKIKLKAKVAAGKKANKKLVWTSSNTKFATVNQKGVVKTTKAGKGKKVKITARTTDGSNKKKVFVIRIK